MAWGRACGGLGLNPGRWLFLVIAVSIVTPAPAQPVDVDAAPIRYADTAPDNPVSRLAARLAAGQAKLTRDDDHGYLKALLKELEVPTSSQTLAFSKTSLQRDKIGPKTPRAVYFNDDVYVAWCVGGDHVEASAADPDLGAVFYTLEQRADRKPRFAREVDNCTLCHASRANHQGFPGHLVRSASTRADGFPDLSVFRVVDHATPLSRRWGGWYVTGKSRGQEHMGNRAGRATADDGEDVLDLGRWVEAKRYLTPHSDLVALLVLEHQAEGHNRIGRAGMLTRIALQIEAEANKALGEPLGTRRPDTTTRIRAACEPLVEYLLFAGEAKIAGPVSGTSDFAKEFAARGPADKAARSLRQFDLTTRLFKYPCSYLVYGEPFAALPAEAKDYVLRRMHAVLTGKDDARGFSHLSDADRRSILGILRETLPGLPAYWRE